MKIGIITMHKVHNFGSALQAYALQKYLQNSTKATVELIDYIYPNEFHKDNKSEKRSIVSIIKYWYIQLFLKGIKSKNNFRSFYRTCFCLSRTRHESIESINTNPPIYDVYITGSDQVWNPNTAKGDSAMFCSFAPSKSKIISFAASFAINKIPESFYRDFYNYLSRYSHIGVREESGLDVLKELNIPSSIETMCTCDPTLLLDSSDYDILSQNSTYHIDGKYILVYNLNYAYDPEPAMSNIIKQISNLTGYKVLVLGSYKLQYKDKTTHVEGIGPNEFVYLFKNASYVITSSFHGTMFSLINRVPFYSILPDGSSHDKRISDVLAIVGLSHRGIASNDIEIIVGLSNPYNIEVEELFYKYISNSKEFIKRAVCI